MKAVWGKTGTLTVRFGLKSRCSRRKMNSTACKNSHPGTMYFFVPCVICESDACLINRIGIFLSYIFPFGKNKKQTYYNAIQGFALFLRWSEKQVDRSTATKASPFLCLHVQNQTQVHKQCPRSVQHLFEKKKKKKPCEIQRVSETR